MKDINWSKSYIELLINRGRSRSTETTIGLFISVHWHEERLQIIKWANELGYEAQLDIGGVFIKYQSEEKPLIEQETMTKLEYELRSLMDKYDERYLKLENERQEAKIRNMIDNELNIEALQRQCRIMTAELFATMKNLNILDEEEVKYGGINKFE